MVPCQHVCLKGRTDFKLAMQRDSQKIKDCLTFSGPPDPLRGEEIYRKYVVAFVVVVHTVGFPALVPLATFGLWLSSSLSRGGC